MGIRLIGPPLLALAACSPAGQVRGEPVPDAPDRGALPAAGLQTARIGGIELELVELRRTCAVRFGETQLELVLPPPCRFLARGGAEAAVENYAEAGAVVLIAGPLAAEADYATSEDRVPADRCSHLAQPLFVRNGTVEMGAVQVSALGFCSQSAPDEKFYYGLAHPQG
jgi:hypothetical protein